MKELVGAATTIVLVSLAILFLHQLVTAVSYTHLTLPTKA